MKPKKDKKADLERSRIIFFEIGVIISLSIILLAFEWSTKVSEDSGALLFTSYVPTQTEIIATERKEEQKTEEKLKITEIFNVFDDDIKVEDLPEIVFEDNGAKLDNFRIPDLDPEPVDPKPILFYLVEEKPTFRGGSPDKEFTKFIYQHIDYPSVAEEHGIEGRVVLSFIIDKKGRLTNIEVIGPAHFSLNEEAVRVVSMSPLWTPGKQRGIPVDVRFEFPIVFRLN